MPPRTWIAAALVVGLACLTCGSEEPPPPTGPPSSAAETPEASAAPTPAPGLADVEVFDGRWTVRSNGASTLQVLARLQRLAGFELTAEGAADAPLTARAEDLAPARALPLLLPADGYRATFAYDPIERRHRLVSLELAGARPTPAQASRGARAAPPAGDPRVALRERTQRRVSQTPEREDGYAGRDGGHARDIGAITPEGLGLELLVALARNDPDPAVRRAAVSRLEDADGYAAVEGLLAALDDPDRSVVIEALDALEFAADESVIPRIEPLLDHPDKGVRRAAREAVEFLRD
ncbi:MAG: HEAT repeat domain-containing protein [Proteobacteria bacterium]|nr:HEAT repeat domain-containing protein [Pseudomonadota bacterium]